MTKRTREEIMAEITKMMQETLDCRSLDLTKQYWLSLLNYSGWKFAPVNHVHSDVLPQLGGNYENDYGSVVAFAIDNEEESAFSLVPVKTVLATLDAMRAEVAQYDGVLVADTESLDGDNYFLVRLEDTPVKTMEKWLARVRSVVQQKEEHTHKVDDYAIADQVYATCQKLVAEVGAEAVLTQLQKLSAK
jgi:hypothetical protein